MRILTVFTGGTIGSSRVEGAISPKAENAFLLLNLFNEKYGAAAFDTVAPYTILSENMDAGHLNNLRSCVEENLGKGYGGIIVTHGTDTLQYSAAYLDLALGLTEVPVVLVSSNYPLSDSRANGLANFAAAVEFIRSGKGRGVFVSYLNSGDDAAAIHRGAEVLPHQPYDDKIFSLFNNVYGRVKDGRFEKNPAYRERERAGLGCSELSGRVLFLRPYVGMTYPDIPDDAKAVLLEGWHSGTLPTAHSELREFCKKARARGVPLYLTGSQDGFVYESKLAFGSMGIEVLPPMSPIAAYFRLWLSVGGN